MSWLVSRWQLWSFPKNLGYAGIAQLPVEYGLYAVAAGALLYAVFGTSRQIATGPSSSLAAVAAGAVLATDVARGTDQRVRRRDHDRVRSRCSSHWVSCGWVGFRSSCRGPS